MIPKFLLNVRLDLVNEGLVKSMLTMFGVSEQSKITAFLDILSVAKQSNPDAKTLGDLLEDVDLKQLLETVATYRSKEVSKKEHVECPECGTVFLK